jgi:hypothetical protein
MSRFTEIYLDTLTREDMELFEIYVDEGDEETPFYTPDGVGCIWLYYDDEQTKPMTPEDAAEEIGAGTIYYIESIPKEFYM